MGNTAPRFDTAQLGPLREVVKKLSTMNVPICDIIQFRVVVDANSVIADLIWKVRYPERGLTALEELIKATVIIAHAPLWLEIEMASAIPQVAAKRKLPAAELWAHWREYRTLLIWDETLRQPPTDIGSLCDPKDAPYVLLETRIRADGILSKDRHIARLGGHPLTPDFVLSSRNYARAVVVAVSVRVLGVVVPWVAVVALIELLRGVGRRVAALPNSVKATLLVSAIVALAHPGSRRWIADRCADVAAAIAPAWDTLADILTAVATMHNESRSAADAHLSMAVGLVRPKQVPLRSRRTLTRRRRARLQKATNSSRDSGKSASVEPILHDC